MTTAANRYSAPLCLSGLHGALRQYRAIDEDLETLRALHGAAVPVLVACALGDELSRAEARVRRATDELAAALLAEDAAPVAPEVAP